jgi:hypothetical protein
MIGRIDMTKDHAQTIAELMALDLALALIIDRDRQLGVPDAEIVERIRKAVADETNRRQKLDRKEQSHA